MPGYQKETTTYIKGQFPFNNQPLSAIWHSNCGHLDCENMLLYNSFLWQIPKIMQFTKIDIKN